MNQLQKPSIKTVFALTVTATLLSIMIHQKNKKNEHAQKIKMAKSMSSFQKQKIILAIDPQNLFINYSDCRIQGYKCLEPKKAMFSGFPFKYFGSSGNCYREKASAKSIRNFIRKLKQNQDVKVMIYTKISQNYCNQILLNLGILNYFTENQKIFTKNKHKSAEEIYFDTRKVIIISANKQDKKDGVMSSNHNLILQLGKQPLQDIFLSKLQQYLQKLIKDCALDNLHDEMYHLALQMNIPLFNHQSYISN